LHGPYVNNDKLFDFDVECYIDIINHICVLVCTPPKRSGYRSGSRSIIAMLTIPFSLY